MDYKKETIKFFKEISGIKNIDINTNIASPQYHIFDLDAEHMMLRFFEKFKVEYTGFDVSDYFHYPNYTWRDLIFIRRYFKKEYPIKKPLTLEHLSRVAEKGKWFSSDLQS